MAAFKRQTESDLKSCANSFLVSIFIWSLYNCRVFEKERLTGWHHVASSPIAAYGLYRIAGDEWVRHEKLPDSWEIGQVVQWGGNAVSSVKLCQKLLRSLFTDQEVQGTQHTTQANLRY